MLAEQFIVLKNQDSKLYYLTLSEILEFIKIAVELRSFIYELYQIKFVSSEYFLCISLLFIPDIVTRNNYLEQIADRNTEDVPYLYGSPM